MTSTTRGSSVPDQKTVERKPTEVPGPRIRITLDIAEASLPTLLAGEPATEIRLSDNGDGTYSLLGLTTVGATRDSGVKPVSDVLVEMLNDITRAIDLQAPAVPDSVHDVVAKCERRWQDYRGEAR